MDLLQNIIVISPKETDSLTCLEELDSEDDADGEMAEETVLPFGQEVDHNMNAPACKPLLSSDPVDTSLPLIHEDIIPPHCKTPTPEEYVQLDNSEIDPTCILNPITPTKSIGPEDSNESPWSPTANLKMLISAASPEIRNRERQKNRYSLKEDGKKLGSNGKIKAGKKNKTKLHKGDSSCDDLMTDGDIQMESDSQISHSSRKEKSLGLLCHRFLSRFLEYPDPEEITEICLDEVAKELCVERRRIYDIINVLESVEIVSRLAKNKYLWHGKTNLKYTLAKLKALAKLEGFAQQVEMIKEFEVGREFEGLVSEEDYNSEKAKKISCECDKKAKSFKATCKNFLRDNQKKDKSLGIMSQRFIMLFLLSKPKTVNLDLSAKILIGDPNIDKTENAKFKTKIRRLYDIANILTSLGLIKKVHVTECRGRKPAFKYTGPETDDIDSFSTCSHDAAHRPSSRHSLLDCIQNPHVSSMLTSTSSSNHSSVIDESNDYKSVSAPPHLAKKSFSRHSSFEQICEVAELERNRLYYESAKSQPTSPTRDDSGDSNSQAKSIIKAPAAKCLLVPKSENKNDTAPKKDAKQQTKSAKMVILRAVDSGSQTFTLSENQLRGLLKNVGANVVSTVGVSIQSAARTIDATVQQLSTALSSDTESVCAQQELAGSLMVTQSHNQTVPPKHVTLVARDGQSITKRLLEEGHCSGEPLRKQIKIANGRHVSRKIILPVKLANGLQRKVVISHPRNNSSQVTNGFKEDSENHQNTTPITEHEKSVTVSSAHQNGFCHAIQTVAVHHCTKEALACEVQPMKAEIDVKQTGAMFLQSLSPPVYHVSGLNSPVMLLPKQQTSPLDTQENRTIQSPDQVIQGKPVVPSSHVVLSKSISQQFVSGLGQFVSPVTAGTPRTSGSIVLSSSEFSPLSGKAPLLTQSSHQLLLSNGMASSLASFPGQAANNEAVNRSKASMPLSSSNIINLVPLFSSTNDQEQVSPGHPTGDQIHQILTPVHEPVTSTFVINPHQELSQSQVIQLPVRRPDAVYLTPNTGIKQILVNGKPISTPGCFFHSTPGGLQQVTSSAITCGQNSAFQTVSQFTANNSDAALSAPRKLFLSSDGHDRHL